MKRELNNKKTVNIRDVLITLSQRHNIANNEEEIDVSDYVAGENKANKTNIDSVIRSIYEISLSEIFVLNTKSNIMKIEKL